MSSNQTPKRGRTKVVCTNRIRTPDNPKDDPFFSEKKREKRVQKFSGRKVADRRWMKFGWLENQGFTFQRSLVFQGLRNFCEFHHPFYTEAVKDFYANFTKNEFGY